MGGVVVPCAFEYVVLPPSKRQRVTFNENHLCDLTGHKPTPSLFGAAPRNTHHSNTRQHTPQQYCHSRSTKQRSQQRHEAIALRAWRQREQRLPLPAAATVLFAALPTTTYSFSSDGNLKGSRSSTSSKIEPSMNIARHFLTHSTNGDGKSSTEAYRPFCGKRIRAPFECTGAPPPA